MKEKNERLKKTMIKGQKSEWGIQKLSEIIESLEAGVSVNSDDKPATENEIGVLKTSAVFNGRFLPSENKIVKSEEINRIKLNPIKDSIIISRMNTPELVGEIGYVDKTYHNLFLPDRLWQTIYKKKVNGKWLAYLLTLPSFKRQIKNIATGTSNSMKNISKKAFLSLEIPNVGLEEQQKIASILSTWDKAIELKEKLIEQKKEQKKGLMQKLLTGEVRLPGFSDKWEKKKIGELLEESKVIAKNPQLDKRITVRLNLKGVCKREISTVEKEGATTQYIRKEGQFIYGKQNLHKGAFGLIPKELDGFQSSSDIPCFDFKEGVDGLWFYYYFSRESFYTNLENISSGTGSKRIQPKELYKLTIKLPSLREQQRQSKILECSDKEIYLLEKELETYRKQKQGLMQLLLTGKVRVKV
ncbi:restriction endonuclease subunit S [Exiguobacterium sp. s37]|uniref:restriction endonuclease subunit S n=1 Tax=Exiguobacterium sp. s37 TaxID=2751275 RepID=UPI0020368F7B|nr:restriction endonuclease subunit S [Exiguobacterium sp. s37]